MQKKKYLDIGMALAIAALAFAVQPANAESDKQAGLSKQLSANEIIGLKVKNTQDEDLGKVSDLIVDLNSGHAPYAVISHGGTFGAGRNKTAVPLQSLQCASDGKSLTLNATKDQLRAASKSPTGEWASVKDAAWAQSVDGYYGDPALATVDRTDRSYNDRDINRSDRERNESGESRKFVRDTAPKGAELLMQPADRALYERVSESLDAVNVQVENGVTKLHGTVDTQAERDRIEARVKTIPGVNKVESHIKVRNP